MCEWDGAMLCAYGGARRGIVSATLLTTEYERGKKGWGELSIRLAVVKRTCLIYSRLTLEIVGPFLIRYPLSIAVFAFEAYIMAASYTNEEAADTLMILGEAQQNFSAAARLYAQRFPERTAWSRKVFKRLANRTRTKGKLLPTHNKNAQIRRPVRQEKSEGILAAVLVDPHVSTRQLERESGVSRSTIGRILKENSFHPYHVELHQELLDGDLEKRRIFCQWYLQTEEVSDDKKLWTDECTFKNTGEVNSHNMHYWAQANPHWMREVDNQHPWSLNVWCGILGDRIIGPFFLDEHLDGQILNGQNYANFLQNTVIEYLEDTVPLYVLGNLWLQQDGCPAHYSRAARDVLNRLFPGRWIGRGGPVE